MTATRLSALLLSATAFPLLGCGGSNPDDIIASVNRDNIQRLANLYVTYQSKNGWRGPEDEEDFRSFISGYNPRKLDRMGVDPEQMDTLFVNERDGEPFRIRYGVPGSIRGSSEPVIFEAVGAGDERRVGFLDMQQRDVDAVEYDRLWGGDES